MFKPNAEIESLPNNIIQLRFADGTFLQIQKDGPRDVMVSFSTSAKIPMSIHYASTLFDYLNDTVK